MKRKINLFMIVATLIAITSSNTLIANENKNITGNWHGTLNVKGMELRIIFKILQNDNSELSATMDSPDQGATDIPVDDVIFNNQGVILKINIINGFYQGDLQDNKTIMKGKWVQNGLEFPLQLKKVDSVTQVNRPQEPKPPFPYNEEKVTFNNDQADITLAGTLTFPKSKGPYPAVILISGSGAQDRDETINGHRPFWVQADYLTRHGYAVLRFDDRGVGQSTGDFAASTIEDFATDVEAALDYLKSNNQIKINKMGLLGHSEGGLVASLVASQSSDIDFIILMATPGKVGSEVICDQVAALNKAYGLSENVIEQNVALQRKILTIIKTEENDVIARQKLENLVPDKSQIKALLSPGYRFMLSFDPKVVLKKVTCPVLALNGSKDVQVSAAKNLKSIENALKEGGNSQFLIKIIPDANHLFQTANTGLMTEYGKIEETIAPQVLELIVDWISEL